MHLQSSWRAETCTYHSLNFRSPSLPILLLCFSFLILVLAHVMAYNVYLEVIRFLYMTYLYSTYFSLTSLPHNYEFSFGPLPLARDTSPCSSLYNLYYSLYFTSNDTIWYLNLFLVYFMQCISKV